MSWKPEVIADSSGEWCGNALRFPTEDEAKRYVLELHVRWTSVRDTRVIESNDPANYRWDNEMGAVRLVSDAEVKAYIKQVKDRDARDCIE